jgi:hypothetical protein
LCSAGSEEAPGATPAPAAEKELVMVKNEPAALHQLLEKMTAEK